MSICVWGGIFKLKTLHLHILCICMIQVSEGEPVMAHVWRLSLFSPFAFSETKHGSTGLVVSKDPTAEPRSQPSITVYYL